MSLTEMAQAYPEMSISIKASDLLAAFESTAQKLLAEAERRRRSLEQQVGCKLVKAEQVREDLGVSTTTLHRWKQSGYLTPVKLGGKPYYRLADIEAILEAREEK